MTSTPAHYGTTGFVKHRPNVSVATEYGNAASFWVEYPSGLVDLTRSSHIPNAAKAQSVPEEPDQELVHQDDVQVPPLIADKQWELEVDGDRSLRLSKASTAFVIVDMQKYVNCSYRLAGHLNTMHTCQLFPASGPEGSPYRLGLCPSADECRACTTQCRCEDPMGVSWTRRLLLNWLKDGSATGV